MGTTGSKSRVGPSKKASGGFVRAVAAICAAALAAVLFPAAGMVHAWNVGDEFPVLDYGEPDPTENDTESLPAERTATESSASLTMSVSGDGGTATGTSILTGPGAFRIGFDAGETADPVFFQDDAFGIGPVNRSILMRGFDFNAPLPGDDLAAGDTAYGDYGLSLRGAYTSGRFQLDASGSYLSGGRNGSFAPDFFSPFGWNDTVLSAGLRRVSPSGWRADEYAFSLGAGYMFDMGALTLGPYARAGYSRTEIGGLGNGAKIVDAGRGAAVRFDNRNIESFTTSIGGKVAYALTTSLGVLTPYLRLEWEHEHENEPRLVKGRLAEPAAGASEAADDNVILITTDDPDRDYFNLGLGFSMMFPHGILAFVDYETILGLEDLTNHQFAAGLVFEY